MQTYYSIYIYCTGPLILFIFKFNYAPILFIYFLSIFTHQFYLFTLYLYSVISTQITLFLFKTM